MGPRYAQDLQSVVAAARKPERRRKSEGLRPAAADAREQKRRRSETQKRVWAERKGLRPAVAAARDRERQRRSETQRRVWAERKALQAKRSEAAKRGAATRALKREAERVRLEAIRLRRSDAQKRRQLEERTLDRRQLERVREARRATKDQERYERAERRAIQTEARRENVAHLKSLVQREVKSIARAESAIWNVPKEKRARHKARAYKHIDRLEALADRRDLARRNVPESLIYKVKITDAMAVKQLATALGVTAHSIYTMRLSPKATGSRHPNAQALGRRALDEMAGIR